MPINLDICPSCGGSGIVAGATPDADPAADPAAAQGQQPDLMDIIMTLMQSSGRGGSVGGLDPNSPGQTQTLVPGDATGKVAQLAQVMKMLTSGNA